ncbi:MAG: hypothetical protein QM784_33730 [Polyangiaceae bacterium]
MRLPLLLGAWLLVGCEELDAWVPSLDSRSSRDHASVVLTKNAAAHRKEHPAGAHVSEAQWESLRQRWTFPAPPSLRELVRCTDVAPNSEDAALSLVFVDAREQTKNLIPRRISERLETVDVSTLRATGDSKEGTAGESEDYGGIFMAWQKRHFAGVFYVTDFAGPALVLRVGELKRSWFAGHLTARFVVHDTLTSRSVCGYSLSVQNETKDAPIRARLQAETRVRLERELGDAMLAAARTALTSDTASIRFPDVGTDGDPLRHVPRADAGH